MRDCGHSGASTNVYFSGFDEIRGLILRDGEGEIDQSAGGNVNCVCCILDSGIFFVQHESPSDTLNANLCSF